MKALRLLLASAFCSILTVSVSYGQVALYAELQGHMLPVRRVDGSQPYVDGGSGKLVAGSKAKLALGSVAEYAPLYVSIRNIRVGSSGRRYISDSRTVNNEFHFQADFESPYVLNHVFVVLEMNSPQFGVSVFIHEVGDLHPRQPKFMEFAVAFGEHLDAAKYKLHLFSDGAELFHSQMPFALIEAKLDQTVRHKIAGVDEEDAKPFVGPSPDYPAKLQKAKVSGSAVVKFTVAPNGRVLNPEVTTATDPAFGEAALAAARQWRFLPRIKAGTPVAAVVEFPFEFTPPK